jgi:hypothetical protein
MYTLKVGGQFRHSPEDVIYFELLRRGYKVYIGKVRKRKSTSSRKNRTTRCTIR